MNHADKMNKRKYIILLDTKTHQMTSTCIITHTCTSFNIWKEEQRMHTIYCSNNEASHPSDDELYVLFLLCLGFIISVTVCVVILRDLGIYLYKICIMLFIVFIFF
eukprot:786090_1